VHGRTFQVRLFTHVLVSSRFGNGQTLIQEWVTTVKVETNWARISSKTFCGIISSQQLSKPIATEARFLFDANESVSILKEKLSNILNEIITENPSFLTGEWGDTV